MNEISECVKTLNGVKEGTCRTNLTYYSPNLRDESKRAEFPRHTFGLYPLGQPNKYYSVILEHNIVLEADPSIFVIMNKLQSYNSTVILHFEVYYFYSSVLLCFCLILVVMTDDDGAGCAV